MSKFSKALGRLVDKLRPIDYYGAYECTIKAVNADKTIDLDPFDPRLKPGPQHVKIMAPAGYETITPKTGGLCMMSFKNGSPDQPFVEYFALGAKFSEVAIRADKIVLNGGSAAVARKGDKVGTLSGTAPSMGGAVTFTLTPPKGAPVTSTSIDLKIEVGNETIKA